MMALHRQPKRFLGNVIPFLFLLLVFWACDDKSEQQNNTTVTMLPPVSPEYPAESEALSIRCAEGGVVTVARAQIPDLVHDSMIIVTAKAENVSVSDGIYSFNGPLFIETGLGVPVCIHSAALSLDSQCNVSGAASIPVLKLGDTTMFRWLDDTQFPVEMRTGATLKGDGWLDTDTPVQDDRLYMMFDVGQQGIHANGIGDLVIETPGVVSAIPLPGFLVVFDPLDPSIYWGLRIGVGDKATKIARGSFSFPKPY